MVTTDKYLCDPYPYEVDHWPTKVEYLQRLDANNPTFGANNVTSTETVADVFLVADPFLVPNTDGSGWVTFIEQLTDPDVEYVKDVGYGTSTDFYNWTYQAEANTDGLKSFPHVFRDNGQWYMAPMDNDYDLDIYTTTDANYPTGWTLQKTYNFTELIRDAVVFRMNDENGDSRWWMLYSTDRTNLYVKYSNVNDDILNATWNSHPDNPVRSVTNKGRPGGVVLVRDHGDILFYLQDSVSSYGDMLLVFEATLTTTTFSETQLNGGNPYLGTADDDNLAWNDVNMHHCSPVWGRYWGNGMGNCWVMAVDGIGTNAPVVGAQDGSWQCGIYISKIPAGSTQKTINGKQQVTTSGIIETVTR